MHTLPMLSVAAIAVVSITAVGGASARAAAGTDTVSGAAARGSPTVQNEAASQQAGPVTEVTVEGRREKLSRLRKKIRDAETAFFEQFDKVNTVPAYETHCTNEIPTDSHISMHVCTPQFIHEISQDGAQSFALGTPPTMGPAAAALRSRAYRKYLHEMIQRDPTLHQAARDFDALIKEYQSTRHQKPAEK